MNAIRRLRLEKGMTQVELAEFAGVTNMSISNWEREIVVPSKRSLLSLAEALETEPKVLGYGAYENTIRADYQRRVKRPLRYGISRARANATAVKATAWRFGLSPRRVYEIVDVKHLDGRKAG